MTDEQIVATYPPTDESTRSRYDWLGPALVLAIVGAVVFFINYQFFRIDVQKVCDREIDSTDRCAAPAGTD